MKGTLDEDLTEGTIFTLSSHPSIEGFLVTSEVWSTNVSIFVHFLIALYQNDNSSKQLCLSTSCSLSADIVSTVEFNYDGELLATGDKGGRIVIFQKEDAVSFEPKATVISWFHEVLMCCPQCFRIAAERITTLWRIQRLQYFPESRTGVRLFKKFRDRGEN